MSNSAFTKSQIATPVSPTLGGTGVANNSANTLTFTGSFSLGLTLSANTALTLPTSGTLVTLTGSQSLTNKSVNGVTLVTGGTATKYLSEDGTYTTPAGGGGITIGSTSITSGTDTRVLFQDGSVVGEDAGLTFTKSTGVFNVSGTAVNTIIASSSHVTGTSFLLNNSSSGAHNFQFFTTGSSNNPGNFGVFDATSVKTILNLNGTTGNFGIIRDAVFTWSSDASFAQNSPDTGFSRTAATKVALGNATAGDFSGTFIVTAIELGNLTDTTLSRLGAADVGIEGVSILTTSNTKTLTNKTMIATTNVVEEITTVASSGTPTPTGGSLRNFFTVTALAANATFAAPSGTPVDGNYLTVRIKDNGTARTLAFNAIYRAIGITLPTTTVLSKTLYLTMRYNFADTKWDVLAMAQEA